MENASKALIMAGGVLIALLIIGSLVLMATEISDYQNNEDQSRKQEQIAKFNSQFEPFNKEELTLMEMKSVFNKINSNNSKNPEYKITSNILTDSNIKNLLENNQIEDIKIGAKFRCTEIKYNKDVKGDAGRIKEMNFVITYLPDP